MMGKARYVAAAACAALLAAGAGACGTSVSVVTEGAAQGPTIAIGVAADQPGLGYLHGGEYSGFDIDVAKYVAKTLGYAEKQIVFKQLSPAMRASALTDGTVDMVVDSFSMDGTHDGEADVAGPYLTVREALLIRSDSASEITGTDSLSDKTVCAVAGSAADDNIRNRTKNTRTTVAERDTYPTASPSNQDRTSWSGKSTPHCVPWSRTARGRRPRPTWASRSDTRPTRP